MSKVKLFQLWRAGLAPSKSRTCVLSGWPVNKLLSKMFSTQLCMLCHVKAIIFIFLSNYTTGLPQQALITGRKKAYSVETRILPTMLYSGDIHPKAAHCFPRLGLLLDDGVPVEVLSVLLFTSVGDAILKERCRTVLVSDLHESESGLFPKRSIVLIEKKDKDKIFSKIRDQFLLINVDAKKASKAIALSIKKVIGNSDHCDQTAYVCKKSTGELFRLINAILECMDENDIEAILFSADFLKALDSVEHSFIISTLRVFGFGPDFSQSPKTFFQKCRKLRHE